MMLGQCVPRIRAAKPIKPIPIIQEWLVAET